MVEKLPQGHFCISCVRMLEGRIIDIGHRVQRKLHQDPLSFDEIRVNFDLEGVRLVDVGDLGG